MFRRARTLLHICRNTIAKTGVLFDDWTAKNLTSALDALVAVVRICISSCSITETLHVKVYSFQILRTVESCLLFFCYSDVPRVALPCVLYICRRYKQDLPRHKCQGQIVIRKYCGKVTEIRDIRLDENDYGSKIIWRSCVNLVTTIEVSIEKLLGQRYLNNV